MSLEETRNEFNVRIQEGEAFVAFIERLQNSPDADVPIKTLKASCFLLLYNLIESTLTGAIESIHEEIEKSGHGFDECRDELKQEFYRLLRKRNWSKISENIVSINKDIVRQTFVRREVFSGNLDPKKFREQAQKYGFQPPKSTKQHRIRELKDKRNDLAHGVFSFAEIGRELSIKDMQECLEAVSSFLTEALAHIDEYLTKKEYLKPSLSPAS